MIDDYTELHWYNFVFTYRLGNYTSQHNTYSAMAEKFVRLCDIEEAKEFCGIESDAVLTGVHYLGYLSKNKFNEEG